MDIAILGTGNVGSVLGRRLAFLGHSIFFGSRDPNHPRVQSLVGENEARLHVSPVAEAVRSGEIVILAVPYDSLQELLSQVPDWEGKILVDCTNPLNSTFTGLQLGFTSSAAEQIALWAPGGKVVKALNTASVATIAQPSYEQIPATMFYCGDDMEAKRRVGELIAELGFEGIDSGPLQHARYLEPMAMLYIHLAVHQRWGGNCALKMLRRRPL